MANKKLAVKSYAAGVGQRSKRRTGIIVQSIRLPVADNNRMHKAAKVEGISFNGWAKRILKRESDKVLARAEKQKAEA